MSTQHKYISQRQILAVIGTLCYTVTIIVWPCTWVCSLDFQLPQTIPPSDPRLGAQAPKQPAPNPTINVEVKVDKSSIPEAGSFGALLDQAGEIDTFHFIYTVLFARRANELEWSVQ